MFSAIIITTIKDRCKFILSLAKIHAAAFLHYLAKGLAKKFETSYKFIIFNIVSKQR